MGDLLGLMQYDEAEKQNGHFTGGSFEDRVGNAIAELALRKSTLTGTPMWFTADDVREMAGEPPDGVDPRVFGTFLLAAKRAGIAEPVPGGYVSTRRKTGHSHPQRAWRGVPK